MPVSTRTGSLGTATAAFLPPAGIPTAGARSLSITAWPATARDDERRQAARRSLRCEMLLIDDVMEEKEFPPVIPAECFEIGEGGLYGSVPIGYGVAIGQKYTFRLTVGERGPEPGALQIITQKGKIVRAELLVGADGFGDRVGIGVRLYGHREGMVPMPSRV